VIITTGFGTIDDAVKAMRLGAADFLTKPINLEHLRLVIQRALRERALQDEVTALREQLHERFAFHSILSKSPRMHDVFELINHVAQTISTVLIFGETGTGKELVARRSTRRPRASGPSSRSTAKRPNRPGERAVRPRRRSLCASASGRAG
jgi:DNA-binding NtrC family response regulator